MSCGFAQKCSIILISSIQAAIVACFMQRLHESCVLQIVQYKAGSSSQAVLDNESSAKKKKIDLTTDNEF